MDHTGANFLKVNNMIDWQKYNETFQWYGKDVEIELIEMLENEFEDRMARISKNVAERDFEQLKFNTHSLKGSIANYHAEEPIVLARELEAKAKESNAEGIDDLCQQLLTSTKTLLDELLAHRQELLEEKARGVD